LVVQIPRRPRIGLAALITIGLTVLGAVAKAAFHVAGVDTRLGVVEVQVIELRKDSDAREIRDRDTDARGRRMELILCRLCAKDPECRGACGD
jgi:chorismate synthase